MAFLGPGGSCYHPDMSSPRIFTYEEALETFPQVQRLTHDAVRRVESLVQQIQSLDEMSERRDEIEDAYRAIVDNWVRQIQALGCEVKGLWLVDWDNGGGYYCWRYPEESLGFFHTYEDGFQGRIPIN